MIKGSELQLPLSRASKSEIDDLILKATEPQMVLYDDWLKTVRRHHLLAAPDPAGVSRQPERRLPPSARAARSARARRAHSPPLGARFRRSRTSLCHAKRCKVLRPDKDTVTRFHPLWPTLTDEVDLRRGAAQAILVDYGKKNNVNVASLTQPEIRDHPGHG